MKNFNSLHLLLCTWELPTNHPSFPFSPAPDPASPEWLTESCVHCSHELVWDKKDLVVFSDQIEFLPSECTERHTATSEEAGRLDSVVS